MIIFIPRLMIDENDQKITVVARRHHRLLKQLKVESYQYQSAGLPPEPRLEDNKIIANTGSRSWCRRLTYFSLPMIHAVFMRKFINKLQ